MSSSVVKLVYSRSRSKLRSLYIYFILSQPPIYYPLIKSKGTLGQSLTLLKLSSIYDLTFSVNSVFSVIFFGFGFSFNPLITVPSFGESFTSGSGLSETLIILAFS